MADSKAETGKVHNESEHLVLSDNRKTLKKMMRISQDLSTFFIAT